MKERMYYWVLVICYFMCITRVKSSVISTPVNYVKTADFNEENRTSFDRRDKSEEMSRSIGYNTRSNWTSSGMNWRDILFEQPRNTMLFPVKRMCSRYCIKRRSKHIKDFKYINLFWSANAINITDTPFNVPAESNLKWKTPEFTWTDGRDSNNLFKDCQIYLDLDCNIVEMGRTTNYVRKQFSPDQLSNNGNESDSNRLSKYSTSRILVEEHNLDKYTETKFVIDKAMHRIVIDINGNVSFAVLQIPTNTTTPWSAIVISLVRQQNAEGVKIEARNAPPGEWRMKLKGEEQSKYEFTVVAFTQEDDVGEYNLFFPTSIKTETLPGESYEGELVIKYPTNLGTSGGLTFDNSDVSNGFIREIYPTDVTSKQENWSTLISSKLFDSRKIPRERSLDNPYHHDEKDEAIIENLNLPPIENRSTMKSFSANNFSTYANYGQSVGDGSDVLSYWSNDGNITGVAVPREDKQKIQIRSSTGSAENLDLNNSKMAATNNSNVSMKIVEASNNQELSEEFTKYAYDDITETKRMVIDVNRNSNLFVTPGTIHRVIFDVMNSCVLPVRYAFRAKSSSFRIYNIQPLYVWVYPEQTSQVAVDLVIPNNISPSTANTVTLLVQGTQIKEKSIFLYAQGSVSRATDDVRPTIEYSFNNNCAGKLDKNRCSKSRWSVDITIQDYDSGLKRVISTPKQIYSRTDFVSGTRNPVTFYYSSTCCDTVAKITAINALDNYSTRTIDVTVWDNLSDAEIAAITVGALLILLLIILIVILIVYCVQRKKSHDLPYTQRYGSRPPAQAERTSF